MLSGATSELTRDGVELVVLAHPAYCQGDAELEAIRALATRPRATHFFKLPWPEQTHPFVTQTPWDVLLREMEEFVDMSARPRHCAQLIQLNRNGARDLATALRQLNRSVEMLFRDDRHLVVPLLESGVVLVAQELGLLLPTTPFTYHSASSSGAAQACSSASAAPSSIFAASPEGQPADDGTRETGERQESEALDSPAKAEAIEELKPMLQPRLESRGVAWEDAHVLMLRNVSLEVLHSCLQAADVRPILVFVFQALDERDADEAGNGEGNLKAQVDSLTLRVKTDRAALDEALKSGFLPPAAAEEDWQGTFGTEDREIDDILHPARRWDGAENEEDAHNSERVPTAGQNFQEDGLVGERARAHEWAEAHGLHHEPVRAGHVRVLEEQQHVASQGGHAVRHGGGDDGTEIGDRKGVETQPQAPDGRGCALGLKWKVSGVNKPRKGHLLTNRQLALALTSRTEFTQEELLAFGISDLRSDHYIKAGDAYFKPDRRDASTTDAKISGSAAFAPAKAGMGSRKRAVPRSDTTGLDTALSARSCTGSLIPVGNSSQKVFVHSLREACYVEPQRMGLASVLDVIHCMAGRPDAKYMITNNAHKDDVDMVRLLPTEAQLRGAGLQHVSRAIVADFGGWDVVMRASDPHGLGAWRAHEVARFLDTFRHRLGAADVAHYRRRALSAAVTGDQLKGMSRAQLAHVLHVHNPAHRETIYKKVEVMRSLKRWSPEVHGNFDGCSWPRDLRWCRES